MLPFRVSSDSARSRLHPRLFARLKNAVLASLRLSANTSSLIGSSHPNLSLSADPHWAMARHPAGALSISLNLPAHGPACQFPTHLPTSSCTCWPAARSLCQSQIDRGAFCPPLNMRTIPLLAHQSLIAIWPSTSLNPSP